MANGNEQRKLTLLTDVDAATLERSRRRVRELAGEMRNLAAAEQQTHAAHRDLAMDETRAVATTRARLASIQHEVQAVIRRNQAFAAEADARTKLRKVTQDQMQVEMDAMRRASYGGMSTAPSAVAAPSLRGSQSTPSSGRASTGLAALATYLPGDAGNVARTASEIARVSETLPSLATGLGATLASMGPLVLVATAAAAAFALISIELEKGRKAAEAFATRESELAKLRVSGTHDEIEARIKDVEARNLEIESIRASTRERLDEIAAIQGAPRSGSTNQAVIAGNPAEIAEHRKQLEELNKEQEGNKKLVSELTKLLHDESVAARSAAEAEQELATVRATLYGAAIDGELKFYELRATGTKESITASLEQLRVQKQVQEDQLRFLRGLASAASGAEAEALAKKIGDLEVQSRNTSTSISSHERALRTSEVITRSATEAERKRAAAINETTQALSYSQQVAQSIVDKQKQIAETNKDFNKQFAALEEQRLKIVEDYERQQLKIIEDAKQDQAAAQRRLAFDIVKILARSVLSEFEALLTLDFAGAARVRRETTFQIGEARADAQFADRERFIETQIRLEDSRVNVEERLVELTKERAQVEVQLVAAIAKIQQQALAAMVASISQLGGLSYAPRITSRAYGGPLAAGQASRVNDGYVPESFLSDGKSLNFPGMGVFIPSRRGTVQPGSEGGVNVAVNMAGMTFNDKREMARVAGDLVEKRLNEVLN